MVSKRRGQDRSIVDRRNDEVEGIGCGIFAVARADLDTQYTIEIGRSLSGQHTVCKAQPARQRIAIGQGHYIGQRVAINVGKIGSLQNEAEACVFLRRHIGKWLHQSRCIIHCRNHDRELAYDFARLVGCRYFQCECSVEIRRRGSCEAPRAAIIREPARQRRPAHTANLDQHRVAIDVRHQRCGQDARKRLVFEALQKRNGGNDRRVVNGIDCY